MKKNTEIMATLGPTLSTEAEIEKAYKLGVKSFRLAIGQRTRDTVSYFQNIRKVEKKVGEKLNVLIDLPSTKLRLSKMKPKFLDVGNEYSFTSFAEETDKDIFILPKLNEIIDGLAVGERVLFRDGKIELKILEKTNFTIKCMCVKSLVELKQGGSAIFPDSNLNYEAITDEDVVILEKMAQNNLRPEMIAISFARNKTMICEVKSVIEKYWNCSEILFLPKIELKEAIENIDDLLDNSDGIFIARGDLLLHTEYYKFAFYQRYLVGKALEKNKLCISGTEYMEYYANNETIIRPELIDLSNSINLGCDQIMLSAETANSKYCFETIKLIKEVIEFENQ
ncbi:MAG: pyruvate kinase [Mycoplasmatales bacterium]